ncbi:hypothetical protein LRS05_08145 [Flavobacterium sp. J372]|uniref:hypothetical protein n=1 Tax=Flavobacterium sp. J372 TaxID=2898436 RepID=UPI002151593D|nr:hypothetical protein [Flavobacterium sp. J372]MCR5862115.1 hypothetical protein [Flavobacterium sp. J372]
MSSHHIVRDDQEPARLKLIRSIVIISIMALPQITSAQITRLQELVNDIYLVHTPKGNTFSNQKGILYNEYFNAAEIKVQNCDIIVCTRQSSGDVIKCIDTKIFNVIQVMQALGELDTPKHNARIITKNGKYAAFDGCIPITDFIYDEQFFVEGGTVLSRQDNGSRIFVVIKDNREFFTTRDSIVRIWDTNILVRNINKGFYYFGLDKSMRPVPEQFLDVDDLDTEDSIYIYRDKSGESGYISNNEVVKGYRPISAFYKKYAFAYNRKNGKMTVINKRFRKIKKFPERYYIEEEFDHFGVLIIYNDKREYGLVNYKGDIILPMGKDYIEQVKGGLFFMTSWKNRAQNLLNEQKTGYYNQKGVRIAPNGVFNRSNLIITSETIENKGEENETITFTDIFLDVDNKIIKQQKR